MHVDTMGKVITILKRQLAEKELELAYREVQLENIKEQYRETKKENELLRREEKEKT